MVFFSIETPIPELDSGSHSPEHEPDASSVTKEETTRDLNLFSNDEGVICDQASTSSSHSTISYKQRLSQDHAGVTSQYSLDDSTRKTDDSRHILSETAGSHTLSSGM